MQLMSIQMIFCSFPGFLIAADPVFTTGGGNESDVWLQIRPILHFEVFLL